jgi:hypothetical protein
MASAPSSSAAAAAPHGRRGGCGCGPPGAEAGRGACWANPRLAPAPMLVVGKATRGPGALLGGQGRRGCWHQGTSTNTVPTPLLSTEPDSARRLMPSRREVWRVSRRPSEGCSCSPPGQRLMGTSRCSRASVPAVIRSD